MTWIHTNPTGILGMPEATCFAGKRLRRVHLNLRRGHHVILVHEPEGQIAFLLQQNPESTNENQDSSTEQSHFDHMSMSIVTERGEPLGVVIDVKTAFKDGKIISYLVGTPEGQVAEIQAKHMYWWQGQLCCRSKMIPMVRNLLRSH